MRLVNLPNLISLARLFLAPVFVWLIANGRFEECFYLCLIAGASDMIDGLVARAMGDQTTLGGYLDPIADKVLLGTIYISLGVYHLLPLWIVILVVFRDFLIFGGALLVLILNINYTIRPLMISKINTCLQIAYVLWLFGILANFEFLQHKTFIASVDFVLLYGMILTLVWSGSSYVIKWVQAINREQVNHENP